MNFMSYHQIRKREIAEMRITDIRNVEIDPDAGAGYFIVMPSASIVATTERRVNIVLDVDGNIIGIELLDVVPPPTSDRT